MPIRYIIAPTWHAINQLARLWTQASPADRAAITRASNAIDAELAEDADQKGNPLPLISPTLRSWEPPPLRVYFHAFVSAGIAQIIEYEQVP